MKHGKRRGDLGVAIIIQRPNDHVNDRGNEQGACTKGWVREREGEGGLKRFGISQQMTSPPRLGKKSSSPEKRI